MKKKIVYDPDTPKEIAYARKVQCTKRYWQGRWNARLECDFVQQRSEKVVVFATKCKNIEESFPYILIYGIFFVFLRAEKWYRG